MKPPSRVEAYLRQTADAMSRLIQGRGRPINGYYSLYEFVLKHGRLWTPAPKPRAINLGPLKNCYQNACELALSGRGLVYCEGYAAGIIPLMHAWCVDEQGRVVDNTWRKPGTEYFGIAFRPRYLLRALLANRHYGLIDAWAERWPLLREKPSAWRHELMDSLSQPAGS